MIHCAEADQRGLGQFFVGGVVARRFTKGDDRVEVAVVEAAENVLEGDDVEPRMQHRF